MKSHSRVPLWPLLSLLICLFVLSVLAPRAWRTLPASDAEPAGQARITTLAELFAEGPRPLAEAPVAPPQSAPVAAAVVQNALELAPPSISQTEEEEFVVASPPAAETSAQGSELGSFAVAPQPDLGPPLVANEAILPREIQSPAPPERQPTVVDPARDPLLGGVNAPPPSTGTISALALAPWGSSPWARPTALIEQLSDLADNEQQAEWAQSVLRTVWRISRLGSLQAAEAMDILADLEKLAERARRDGERAPASAWASPLLRAEYALSRRVALWREVHRVALAQKDGVRVAALDPQSALANIDRVSGLLKQGKVYDSWANYLLFNGLREAAADRSAGNEAQRRLVAQEVLRRMESAALDKKQREVLQSAPCAALASELRHWTVAPVELASMLALLEQFEATGKAADAEELTKLAAPLRWSDEPHAAALHRQLDQHWRNANLRVAVTGELINRLLPVVQAALEDVDDEILGTPVMGRSLTTSKLSVRLIPDSERWRIGLEVDGQVISETAASKGPATFYNDALAQFHARKLLLLGRRGTRVWQAEAEAANQSQLTDVETSFDVFPLVGDLVRNLARSQHDASQYDAQREAEEKIAARASERLDREVHLRLAKGEQQFRQKVLDPLVRHGLEPTIVDMQTTKQRLVARYRLAGDDQLSAYTPRPRAMSDSLLSFQLHQSAINNVIQRLELDGRRADLRTLYREIADAFGFREVEVPEDLPEGVTIAFAPEEAVKVECVDGRMSVTLKLAEIGSGRSRWRNFAVRAYYTPDPSRLSADLVRQGTVELIGAEIGFRDQIALRGIFSKVFSDKRRVNLIHPKFADDPRVADLHVSQFDVVEGWIGVAVAKQR